jgi:D-proline reductase (dithiol) PrdB
VQHPEPLSKTPLSGRLRRRARFALWLQRRLPGLYAAWALAGARRWRQAGVPWTPIGKPLSRCRIALVSSGGFVLPEQEPFDLNDPHGDCSFRLIPNDAPLAALQVSHAFYDSSAARDDADVLFPIAALAALAEAGVVGQAAPRHASFSGSIPDPAELVSDFAPELAQIFLRDEVDLALLTPA